MNEIVESDSAPGGAKTRVELLPDTHSRRLRVKVCLAIVSATCLFIFLGAFCSKQWPDHGFGWPRPEPHRAYLFLKYAALFSALHCASFLLASRHFRRPGEFFRLLADAYPLFVAPATVSLLCVSPFVASPMLGVMAVLCLTSLVQSLLRRKWLDGAATILVNTICIALPYFWALDWLAYFGD